MTRYRIRLTDGTQLHFAADRCRRDDDVLLSENERPTGAWTIVYEIHRADIARLPLNPLTTSPTLT